MRLEEAENILNKNGYLVESDNYVKDFTDDVIEPLEETIEKFLGKKTIKTPKLKVGDRVKVVNPINGCFGAENKIDAVQLLKDLSEIKGKCEDTRMLLRAFNIKG